MESTSAGPGSSSPPTPTAPVTPWDEYFEFLDDARYHTLVVALHRLIRMPLPCISVKLQFNEIAKTHRGRRRPQSEIDDHYSHAHRVNVKRYLQHYVPSLDVMHDPRDRQLYGSIVEFLDAMSMVKIMIFWDKIQRQPTRLQRTKNAFINARRTLESEYNDSYHARMYRMSLVQRVTTFVLSAETRTEYDMAIEAVGRMARNIPSPVHLNDSWIRGDHATRIDFSSGMASTRNVLAGAITINPLGYELYSKVEDQYSDRLFVTDPSFTALGYSVAKSTRQKPWEEDVYNLSERAGEETAFKLFADKSVFMQLPDYLIRIRERQRENVACGIPPDTSDTTRMAGELVDNIRRCTTVWIPVRLFDSEDEQWASESVLHPFRPSEAIDSFIQDIHRIFHGPVFASDDERDARTVSPFADFYRIRMYNLAFDLQELLNVRQSTVFLLYGAMLRVGRLMSEKTMLATGADELASPFIGVHGMVDMKHAETSSGATDALEMTVYFTEVHIDIRSLQATTRGRAGRACGSFMFSPLLHDPDPTISPYRTREWLNTQRRGATSSTHSSIFPYTRIL